MITSRRVVVVMNGMTLSPVLRKGAIAMVVSAALAIVGQAVYVLGFDGGRIADRLDLISQIASPPIGILVLSAAILLAASRTIAEPDLESTTDWVSGAVIALGGVITFAALYSIIRLVSVHVPSPGATGQGIQLRISAGDWSQRLGQIILRLSGGVLGAWGAWTAHTTRAVSDRLAPGPPL